MDDAARVAAAVRAELARDPSTGGLGGLLRRVRRKQGHSADLREPPSCPADAEPWQRNELYFGVRRDSAERADVLLVAALLQAGESIAPILASSSLPVSQRLQVARPLAMLDRVLNRSAGVAVEPLAVRADDRERVADESPRDRNLVLTWLLGHQYFFTIDQFLILLTLRLKESLNGHDWAGSVSTMGEIADLLIASSAAMAMVGDMSPAEYVETIREHVRGFHPDMTALHQIDHACLQGLLQECAFPQRRASGVWPGEVARSFELLQVARSQLLLSHLKICERAVGVDAPSIHSVARGIANPAVATIVALNEARARTFGITGCPHGIGADGDRVPSKQGHTKA